MFYDTENTESQRSHKAPQRVKMEKRSGGGKLDETDSSPGVEHFQQMTSDGSEVHGENGHCNRGKGKSRKNRIIFNAAQLNALERLFHDVAYPDLDLRMKIAERLEIDESRVTVRLPSVHMH